MVEVCTVYTNVCVCTRLPQRERDMLSHGGWILLRQAQLTLLMASLHVQKLSCSLIRGKCHFLDLCLKGPLLWTETESRPLSPTGAALECPSLSLDSLSYFVSKPIHHCFPCFIQDPRRTFLISAVIKSRKSHKDTVEACANTTFRRYHPCVEGIDWMVWISHCIMKRAENNYIVIFNTVIYPFEKPSRLP